MRSSWGRMVATLAVAVVVTSGVTGATVVSAVALFHAPPQFGLGAGPNKGLFPVAIDAGDVSGDGIADVVTANRTSGNVSVLAGDGSGRFGAAVNYPTGKGTSDVAVGNVDGDGLLDVAVTNRGSKTVSLLFNQGGGVFQQPPTNITTGKAPSAVVIGDFNNDDKPDLAVANSDDNTVSLFIGQGGRQFGLGSVIAVGADPESIAVDDFDQNGTLDLAVANRGGSDLSILSGDGAGGFAVQNVLVGIAQKPLQPTAVATADLNGDSHPDLVATVRGLGTPLANSVSVLLWNGGFSAVDSYGKTSAHPSAVAIGDLNLDGYQDVVAGSGDSAQASVLWGTGQGRFEPRGPQLFSAGRAPIGVAVTDLNGDLKPDLAFADSFLDGVTVVPGDGTKVLQLVPTTTTLGSSPVAVAVDDLNGDGLLDAVTADNGAARVSVLLGALDQNGQPFFTKPRKADLLIVGPSPNDVTLGDLNGDGKLDLVVANIGSPRVSGSSSVSVFYGDGAGHFAAQPRLDAVGLSPHSVAIHDLNGDGRNDLVTANMGKPDPNEPSNNIPGSVTVLLNNGDGTFTATTIPAGASDSPVSAAVADLTGDLLPDIAVADYGSNKVTVLKGDGSGSFAFLASYDVGVHPTSVTAKDLTGDGRADLVVTNRYSSDSVSDSVSVLIAEGAALRSAVSFPVGVGHKPVAVGIDDLNHDGQQDLAVALSGGANDTDFCHARGGASGGIAILYGNGSGSFTPAGSYASLNDACDVALVNLNNDSRLDMVVPAARTNVVESYLNETP